MSAFAHTTAVQFLLERVTRLAEEGILGEVITSEGSPHHGAPMDVSYHTNYRLQVAGSGADDPRRMQDFRRSILLIEDCGIRDDLCTALVKASAVTLFISPDTQQNEWWSRPIPFTLQVEGEAEMTLALVDYVEGLRLNLFAGDNQSGLFPKDCLETKIFRALSSREHHQAGLTKADATLQELEEVWKPNE